MVNRTFHQTVDLSISRAASGNSSWSTVSTATINGSAYLKIFCSSNSVHTEGGDQLHVARACTLTKLRPPAHTAARAFEMTNCCASLLLFCDQTAYELDKHSASFVKQLTFLTVTKCPHIASPTFTVNFSSDN